MEAGQTGRTDFVLLPADTRRCRGGRLVRLPRHLQGCRGGAIEEMLVRVAARLLLLFCRDAPDVAGLGPSPWPCAKPCTIHMFLENVYAVCLVEGKLHPACRFAALSCRGCRNAARDNFRGNRFFEYGSFHVCTPVTNTP